MRSTSLALATMLVCACTGETQVAPDSGEHDAGEPEVSDAAPATRDGGQAWDRDAPLVFSACEGAFGAGRQGLTIECADAVVPRDWSDPKSASIALRVERIAPAVGPVRAQIWMLQGGPGGSSLELQLSYAPLLARAIEGAEILLVDHRGVGLSDRLDCPVQEAPLSEGGTAVTESELAGCLRSLETQYTPQQLAVYSTTTAARDLGSVLARSRRDGVPVFVYGVSYGTYWAQRYLALFPDQPSGVILDSICSPDTCRVPIESLADNERAGLALLELCAEDEVCRERFGPDPVARYRALLDRLEVDHCAPLRATGWGRQRVRAVVGTLLSSVLLRQAIPAVLGRLERCEAPDVDALEHLASVLGVSAAPGGGSGDRLRWAEALHLLVRRSEMWEEPSPLWSDVLAAAEDSLFWPAIERHVYESWESMARYPIDENVGRYAETRAPMLMMNGTLDPQTSLLDAAPSGAHFAGQNQHFVVIERGSHGLLAQSPYRHDEPERTCALDLMRAFVQAPDAPLDTSCRTETSTIDFADDRAAILLFGTDSLWEPTARVSRRLEPAQMQLLDEARRAFQRVR